MSLVPGNKKESRPCPCGSNAGSGTASGQEQDKQIKRSVDCGPTCPICFLGEEDFKEEREQQDVCCFPKTRPSSAEHNALVQVPCCKHVFCLLCIEKILLHPSSANMALPPAPMQYEGRICYEVFPPPSRHDDKDLSLLSHMPTRGSCPMCRTPISLFDVTWYEPCSSTADILRQQQNVEQNLWTAAGGEKTKKARAKRGDLSRSSFVVKRLHNFDETPLQGTMYHTGKQLLVGSSPGDDTVSTMLDEWLAFDSASPDCGCGCRRSDTVPLVPIHSTTVAFRESDTSKKISTTMDEYDDEEDTDGYDDDDYDDEHDDAIADTDVGHGNVVAAPDDGNEIGHEEWEHDYDDDEYDDDDSFWYDDDSDDESDDGDCSGCPYCQDLDPTLPTSMIVTESINHCHPYNEDGIPTDTTAYDICFHEGTRTLQFTTFLKRKKTTSLSPGDEGNINIRYQQWRFVLTFSWDYQSIIRGLRMEYKSHPQEVSLRQSREQLLSQAHLSVHDDSCLFPFDGEWEEQMDTEKATIGRSLLIHGNQLIMTTTRDWSTEYDEGTLKVLSLIPNEGSHHEFGVTVAGCSYALCVTGVGAVETLHWIPVAGSPTSRTIAWMRTSPAVVTPFERVIHLPLYLASKDSRKNLGTEVPMRTEVVGATSPALEHIPALAPAKYAKDDLWGNSFVQSSCCIGLASYHFEECGSVAYISFEHEGTRGWPLLDNGSPLPSKIAFNSILWDAKTRFFSGEVDWMSTLGTSFNGTQLSCFEMAFAGDYSCILGGHVKHRLSRSSTEGPCLMFATNLLYVNAGLLAECESGDLHSPTRGISRAVYAKKQLVKDFAAMATTGHRSKGIIDIGTESDRQDRLDVLVDLFATFIAGEKKVRYPHFFGFDANGSSEGDQEGNDDDALGLEWDEDDW